MKGLEVGRWALAVVHRVDGGQRVLIRKCLVESRGSEVFANVLHGIGEGFGDSAPGSIGVQQLRPIGNRPQGLQRLDGRHGRCPRIGLSIGAACGNQSHIAQPQFLAKALVVNEDKRFVLFDGRSYRAAELISLKCRNCGEVEKVTRIEGAVAQEFIGAAMDAVGPGGRHDIDLGSGALAVFRAVGVRHDGEFPHRVHAEKLSADASRRAVDLRGAGVFHAVKNVKVVLGAVA